MKFEKSKEWFEKNIKKEGDYEIGAGKLALDNLGHKYSESKDSKNIEWGEIQQLHNAFGTLIKLKRLEQEYSIEQLAKTADIGDAEIRLIEHDINYLPEPRTVYKLAQVFKLPDRELLKLSGLTTTHDLGLQEEALRFAARSESISKLTKEEHEVLNGFVKYLEDASKISHEK